MACEIGPIFNFLLGSVRTNLLMETVDVELTVQMVKGIYHPRNTAEDLKIFHQSHMIPDWTHNSSISRRDEQTVISRI